jgi:hypothetical protein
MAAHEYVRLTVEHDQQSSERALYNTTGGPMAAPMM